jgi:hypothetical protein
MQMYIFQDNVFIKFSSISSDRRGLNNLLNWTAMFSGEILPYQVNQVLSLNK